MGSTETRMTRSASGYGWRSHEGTLVGPHCPLLPRVHAIPWDDLRILKARPKNEAAAAPSVSANLDSWDPETMSLLPQVKRLLLLSKSGTDWPEAVHLFGLDWAVSMTNCTRSGFQEESMRIVNVWRVAFKLVCVFVEVWMGEATGSVMRFW